MPKTKSHQRNLIGVFSLLAVCSAAGGRGGRSGAAAVAYTTGDATLQTMDFVLKSVDFVRKMMDFAFKKMDLRCRRPVRCRSSASGGRLGSPVNSALNVMNSVF